MFIAVIVSMVVCLLAGVAIGWCLFSDGDR